MKDDNLDKIKNFMKKFESNAIEIIKKSSLQQIKTHYNRLNNIYIDIYISSKIDMYNGKSETRSILYLSALDRIYNFIKNHLLELKNTYSSSLNDEYAFLNEKDRIDYIIRNNIKLKMSKQNLKNNSDGAIELYNNTELLNTISIIDIILLIVAIFIFIIFFFKDKIPEKIKYTNYIPKTIMNFDKTAR